MSHWLDSPSPCCCLSNSTGWQDPAQKSTPALKRKCPHGSEDRWCFKNSSDLTLQGPPCYPISTTPSGFLHLSPLEPGKLVMFYWMSYCAQSGEKRPGLALSSFQILPVNSQYLFCKIEWIIFIPQLREHCFGHRLASTTSLIEKQGLWIKPQGLTARQVLIMEIL